LSDDIRVDDNDSIASLKGWAGTS